jgi:hypothetical protein
VFRERCTRASSRIKCASVAPAFYIVASASTMSAILPILQCDAVPAVPPVARSFGMKVMEIGFMLNVSVDQHGNTTNTEFQRELRVFLLKGSPFFIRAEFMAWSDDHNSDRYTFINAQIFVVDFPEGEMTRSNPMREGAWIINETTYNTWMSRFEEVVPQEYF